MSTKIAHFITFVNNEPEERPQIQMWGYFLNNRSAWRRSNLPREIKIAGAKHPRASEIGEQARQIFSAWLAPGKNLSLDGTERAKLYQGASFILVVKLVWGVKFVDSWPLWDANNLYRFSSIVFLNPSLTK